MDFRLPDIGEGLVEAQIVKWFVKEGDSVKENQPMVEVLTDKANVEIPSPYSGVVAKIYVKENEIARVGEVIISFSTENVKEDREGEKDEKVTDSPKAVQVESLQRGGEYARKVLAAPAVRKLAKEKNIDLSKIKGSGPGGRILLSDLETIKPLLEYTEHQEVTVSKGEFTFSDENKVSEEMPIRGILKAMFDRMALAQKYSSLFTYVEECDVTELVKLRENSQEIAQKDGIKLTYLPFILKAISLSFKLFPKLNATIDEERAVLKIRKDCNIGVAMVVNDNLIVPVLKNVDRKNILQLAKDLNELQDLGRKNQLKPENFKDGGFSVTSLGKYGGVLATPIVNYPQVSILGIHKISLKPSYNDGKLEPRYFMNLSISSDHRVIEGHYAAEFLQEVIKYLQDPKLLLLQLI